jgi:hypothetical protein
VQVHEGRLAGRASIVLPAQNDKKPRNAKRVPKDPLQPKACRPLVIGAGDGIRTHDPNLGKVMLYP